MSKLFVDLTIAFRSLVQHRRRTLFLGAAIAAVTALLVLLNGLSTGMRETMIDTATTLSTGHVNVGGFFKVTAGQAAPVVTDYKKVLEVAQARPSRRWRSRSSAAAAGPRWSPTPASMQLGITGIDIKSEPEFASVLQLVSGKLDDLAQPGTILIFDNQAEKLGVKVGDALTISAPTTRGTNNTIDVRVVAIAHSLGLLSTWNVVRPHRDACARSTSSIRTRPASSRSCSTARTSTSIPAIAARLRKSWRRPATG